MRITLKNKQIHRNEVLHKISNIKFITGVISKQIKDCIEPRGELVKNVIINLASNCNQRRVEQDYRKQSLETTISSISTRHQSMEIPRKIIINNPQTSLILAQHLHELNYKENKYPIKFKNASAHITKATRVILGEWLMQLAQQLEIPKDAVYNALHYTDKYVGMVHVERAKYQSVGLCGLFLASKLEISAHPNINSFIQAMEGTINKDELISLQQHMVIKLKFKLNPPTLYQYMVLLISLFNNFIAKTSPGYIQISKDSDLYKSIFWILDGVFLENQYRNFCNKQKVCLSILYLAIKKYKCYRPKKLKNTCFLEEEALKSYGEVEKVFNNFLSKVILIFKKLSDLQQCVVFYKKWLKYERCSGSPDEQIGQLKKIILSK